MNPFEQHFPKSKLIQEPRPIQKDVFKWMWDRFPYTKRFQLCVPTGGGKSRIGMAVAYYGKSLGLHTCYLTPLNTLIDQISNPIEEFKVCVLKGKKWYPCMSGKKNCKEGFCEDDRCAKGLAIRKCEYAPECKSCGCPNCVYRAIFKAFRKSAIGCTNISLFTMGIDNGCEIVIIDEADYCEDFLRMHYSLTLDGHLDIDFTKAVEELKLRVDVLRTLLGDHDGPDSIKKADEHKKQKEELDKIDRILLDYEEHHEPYVVSNYTNRKGIAKSKIEPITTERFIEPLLSDKIVIMMSATLSKMDGWEYLETPSPFPVAIRQWEWKPLGRFSKEYRDRNIPKLAEYLKTLKGKSVVHCVSYENANKLANELRRLGVYPLRQTNNDDDEDEDAVRRWEAVEAFKKSKKPNEILLSVKLDRGVDFWEPEIQNNIIAFMPFCNPNDPLVKAKNNTIGLSWQDKYVANIIQQAHGRIHRGVFDYQDVIKEHPDLVWLPHTPEGHIIKKTTITDANWNNIELGYFYHRNRNHFNMWFQESEVGYNRVLQSMCKIG